MVVYIPGKLKSVMKQDRVCKNTNNDTQVMNKYTESIWLKRDKSCIEKLFSPKSGMGKGLFANTFATPTNLRE